MRKTKDRKRVQNAEPTKFNGIQFRSKLEVYCYKKLKEFDIKAKYEHYSFPLLDSFDFGNEKIRSINYTPDFVGDGFIIECKGQKTDVFIIKWKLFKDYLVKHNMDYDLFLPRNHKDIDKCVLEIREKIDNGVYRKKKVQSRGSKSLLNRLVRNITKIL